MVTVTVLGAPDGDTVSDGVKSTTGSTYVGFCGYCDTVTQGTPFQNGIATLSSAAMPW